MAQIVRHNEESVREGYIRNGGKEECGRTQLEVSEELGIAQSVISRLWQRFQDDGHIGLYARRPVKCVPLTATHGRLRLTWSREHALWTPQQWSCVMFSDESRFSLQSDSHWTLIWRAPGNHYHPENTIERHRYGGAGWLVWGGIILYFQSGPACSECNDDRPHLSGCHSGTTCTFVSGRHGS
ncbi:HTH_Tnp_Tc3_2 domain-containing protein [Trichonephila clavipes]|nr:HTH_Tnp_Tc3_2 domain-containing protein [Trichonephila clavipes]